MEKLVENITGDWGTNMKTKGNSNVALLPVVVLILGIYLLVKGFMMGY